MSREAMQMALEALEDANDVARMEFSDEDYYSEAINALRQALETEQELGTWREVTYDQLMEEVRNRGYEIRDAKITALRQARSLTDELMDCVDRLGSEADTVDPRVWDHLLVYAPKPEEEPVTAIRLLTEQCAALIRERDELQKQVWRYERHGVTCQTYRHKVEQSCAECNVQEKYT